MRLPYEDCLVERAPTAANLALCNILVFETRSVPCVYFVVPAPSNTPLSDTVIAHNLTRDLKSRAGLPSSWLEIEDTYFARVPVLDFHDAVVVNRRIARNDSHARRRHLLPGIKLSRSASYWSQSQKPCTHWIAADRSAVDI